MTRITTLFVLTLMAVLAYSSEPLTETRCTATAFDGVNTESLLILELPGFSVLAQTASSERFQLPSGLPSDVIEVMCGRSSPVFAPNDYKVPLAGLRLTITSLAATGERRTLELTFNDGQFGFFMTQGKLSDEEGRAQQTRLRDFQDAIRKSE